MSGKRRGVGLFTRPLASQVDYIMMHARRELNVTLGQNNRKHVKLPGPGVRFDYAIRCDTCGHTFNERYAHEALTTLLHHVDRGHRVDLTDPVQRDRDDFETRNADYPDKRRTAKVVRSLDTLTVAIEVTRLVQRLGGTTPKAAAQALRVPETIVTQAVAESIRLDLSDGRIVIVESAGRTP